MKVGMMAPRPSKTMPLDRAAKHRLAVSIGLQALKMQSVKLRRLEEELAVLGSEPGVAAGIDAPGAEVGT